jgi:hypothetical protein
MIQEVYYNLWKEGVLQEKREQIAGKFIFTELERQYVSIEDNIDCFAKDAHGRLGEIYRYIIIGYKDGGNWTGLLDLFKRRLDFLLTDYINRLVASRKYEVDEIIDEMEKWIDTTTEVVSGIIDEQKEDVLTKGATKGTINPTTTKKRLEALDSVRDALTEMMEAKQTRFLHDLPEMDFAEIGPDASAAPAPEAKPKRKKAVKPRKSFAECVVEPSKKDEVIEKIRSLVAGKTGNQAYIIFAAAVKAGLILKPAYNAVVEVFGDIGAESGYSRKMVKGAFLPEELEPLVKILQNPA